jgi:hypothetical protein
MNKARNKKGSAAQKAVVETKKQTLSAQFHDVEKDASTPRLAAKETRPSQRKRARDVEDSNSSAIPESVAKKRRSQEKPDNNNLNIDETTKKKEEQLGKGGSDMKQKRPTRTSTALRDMIIDGRVTDNDKGKDDATQNLPEGNHANEDADQHQDVADAIDLPQQAPARGGRTAGTPNWDFDSNKLLVICVDRCLPQKPEDWGPVSEMFTAHRGSLPSRSSGACAERWKKLLTGKATGDDNLHSPFQRLVHYVQKKINDSIGARVISQNVALVVFTPEEIEKFEAFLATWRARWFTDQAQNANVDDDDDQDYELSDNDARQLGIDTPNIVREGVRNNARMLEAGRAGVSDDLNAGRRTPNVESEVFKLMQKNMEEQRQDRIHRDELVRESLETSKSLTQAILKMMEKF